MSAQPLIGHKRDSPWNQSAFECQLSHLLVINLTLQESISIELKYIKCWVIIATSLVAVLTTSILVAWRVLPFDALHVVWLLAESLRISYRQKTGLCVDYQKKVAPA